MKLLTHPLLVLFSMAALSSCKKDEAAEPTPATPATIGLELVQTATDGSYTVELFNTTGQLKVGYNPVSIRLKNGSGSAVSNANLSWLPMMTMDMGGSTHQHSCPHSAFSPASSDATLLEGHVVFNMASSMMGFWEVTFTYDVGNGPHEVVMPVTVLASDSEFHKEYTSTIGTDSVTYLLALVQPSDPIGGVNNMVVGLYKRVSATEFPVVDGYTIRVDPRMPGMGNHGAPGNVDLTQGADGAYHGMVGFSMTGYWKINLIIEDGAGTVIGGQEVTSSNLESSVHFKVSF